MGHEWKDCVPGFLMWEWLFNVILVSQAGTGEGGTRAVCEESTRAGTRLR